MRMGMTRTVSIGELMQESNERFHGRISDEVGVASRHNPIPRDQTKSPIVGDHRHHHFGATWHSAMDRKVMIAQTLARRTWWDFNLSVMAHGRKALLNMMT